MIVWCKGCEDVTLYYAVEPYDDQLCAGCFRFKDVPQRMILGYDGPIKDEHRRVLDWVNGNTYELLVRVSEKPLQDKIASRTKNFGSAWESLMRRATIEWPKAKPQADYFQKVYANAPTVPWELPPYTLDWWPPRRAAVVINGAQWVDDYYWERAVKPSPADRCLAMVSKMNYTIMDLIDGPNPCIVLGGQDG